MEKINIAKKIVIILLTLFVFTSCFFKKNEITFDKSDPLSLAPDIQWAVITEPYVAFRQTPSWNADTTAHCRMGDVLIIKGQAIVTEEKKQLIWYKFDKGYLSESAISVYQNKYKAMNAATKLLK